MSNNYYLYNIQCVIYEAGLKTSQNAFAFIVNVDRTKKDYLYPTLKHPAMDRSLPGRPFLRILGRRCRLFLLLLEGLFRWNSL